MDFRIIAIGYNSNASSQWSWVGGSQSTWLPSGFSVIAKANQAVQLVTWNPGWAQNEKNAESYFVCEIPCQNGWSARLANPIEENNNDSQVLMYPNPVENNQITVEFDGNKQEDGIVYVMSQLGIIIDRINLKVSEGKNKHLIDLSKLPSGL